MGREARWQAREWGPGTWGQAGHPRLQRGRDSGATLPDRLSSQGQPAQEDGTWAREQLRASWERDPAHHSLAEILLSDQPSGPQFPPLLNGDIDSTNHTGELHELTYGKCHPQAALTGSGTITSPRAQPGGEVSEDLGPLQPGRRISWVPSLLDHRAGPAPASLGGWEMLRWEWQ